MSLKANLPIWVFVLVAATGLATSFLLVNYGVSVLGELGLQSLENAYWTKIISKVDKELAGWKTYRNEEYGLEFKYPGDFGSVGIMEFTQTPPAGEEGRGIALDFSNNDSFWISIFLPKEYKEHDLNCKTEEIDKERIEYCKNIVIAGQNTNYTVGLEYMPEASGAFMVQRAKLYLKKELKGETKFNQGFSKINEQLEKIFDPTGDNIELEKIAYSYLEKIYNNDPTQPETQLVKRFNQILSTFKFIEPVALKPTTKYGIFGDDEFDTIIWGYISIEKEDHFGTMTDIAYLVITKYLHEGFKSAIEDGIKEGNTINKKFGDKLGFRLGCFANNEISGMTKIEKSANQTILNSTSENPMGIILSFEKHGGMGCGCCSLAEKISLY